MSAKISNLTSEYKKGSITGNDLAKLVNEGELTKSERRKITKIAKQKELTPRQLLRLETKSKKQQPKLSKDDRHKKYVSDRNDALREKQQGAHMVCLGCRKEGHILKYCTEIKNLKNVVCFNCGEYDHALRNCTKPVTPGYLPFAECFICHEKGHISRDCTDNTKGLYPDGGCCHICMKNDHLVKDCKLKPVDEDKMESSRKNEISLLVTDNVLKQRDDYIEEVQYGSDGKDIDQEDEEDEEEAEVKPKKKKKKF